MRGARVPVPVARVLAWFAGAGLAVIAAANGPPAFVAGDLIVKFTDASESGALVARAVQGEAGAQRQLPDLAGRLSAGLGVSVIAARVTSGRELVLGIDREQLLASARATRAARTRREKRATARAAKDRAAAGRDRARGGVHARQRRPCASAARRPRRRAHQPRDRCPGGAPRRRHRPAAGRSCGRARATHPHPRHRRPHRATGRTAQAPRRCRVCAGQPADASDWPGRQIVALAKSRRERSECRASPVLRPTRSAIQS
ncbi:MAG: hypothetical protein MZV70_39360 [Desulfobacterales bacterium]|nr:hypothetical protein [Desulfobacterales bacterium]